jgi:hypothetical protein
VQIAAQRFARRPEIHGHGPTCTPLEMVEADVGGDPVQPRADRGATLKVLVGAPRAQQRLLDGVVRLERRSEHPVAVTGERCAVSLQLIVDPVAGDRVARFLHCIHPIRDWRRKACPRQSLLADGCAGHRLLGEESLDCVEDRCVLAGELLAVGKWKVTGGHVARWITLARHERWFLR